MDDYRKLLAHLEENTKFDTVVFDFGTGIPSIAAFLEECSSIYCPVKEGYFYECQKAEFVHYLEQVKPDGMSERLQFVNLPFTAKGIRGGGNMLEQLVWSEFGDYIRDYLAGMLMEKYRWSEEIFDDLRSNIIAALDLSREQNDEEVCRFIEKEVEEYSRKIC